jgi:hypothetical protein
MTPEDLARQNIDRLLNEADWGIQDYKRMNLADVRGIAIREVPLKSGKCDSLLRGAELDEDLDEKSGFELAAADDRPRDVKYSAKIPIEAFDFVVTDECHRSIYYLWRQVQLLEMANHIHHRPIGQLRVHEIERVKKPAYRRRPERTALVVPPFCAVFLPFQSMNPGMWRT